MVTSAKTLALMPTTVYQINRCNQHSNKQKLPCFDNVIKQQTSPGLQVTKAFKFMSDDGESHQQIDDDSHQND